MLSLVFGLGCSSGSGGGMGGGSATGGGSSGGGAAGGGVSTGGGGQGGGAAQGGGSANGGGYVDAGPGGGFAPGTFSIQHTFDTAVGPTSLALADFNLDGRLDMALSCDGVASVLLNTTDPDGGALPVFLTHTEFMTGPGPNSRLAAGDLNGDGLPDLAVANGGASSVSVLLDVSDAGATVPNFTPKVDFATNGNARAVVIADFNGDGRPDLAVANGDPMVTGDKSVSVFLSLTDAGTLTAAFSMRTEFEIPDAPHAMAVADFNLDGKPDLVVASTSSPAAVLLNTTPAMATTPTFAAAQLIGSAASSVAVSDINGDGKPDLSFASTNGLVLMINATSMGASIPSFGAPSTFPGNEAPYALASADLDGDGKPDFAMTEATSPQLLLFRNLTPTGAFDPAIPNSFLTLVTGDEPLSVAIGPLRGAARPDVVTANYASDSVSVFFAH
jgi:hypothetical protein